MEVVCGKAGVSLWLISCPPRVAEAPSVRLLRVCAGCTSKVWGCVCVLHVCVCLCCCSGVYTRRAGLGRVWWWRVLILGGNMGS